MLKSLMFAVSVAVGASLVSGSLLMPVVAHAEAAKVSKKVGDPLNDGLDAAKKGRYPEALDKLKVADSVAGKTAYEQYLINEAYGFVYLKQRKYSAAAAAYEKSLNSSAMPANQVNGRLKQLAQLNFQSPQNLKKVIEYADRYLKAVGGQDAGVQAMLGQAYQLSGNDRAAVAAINQAIKVAGKPEENWLRILLKSYVSLGNAKGVSDTTQRLVRLYPTQDNWRLLSNELRRQAQGDDRTALNVYRLMRGIGIMDNPQVCQEASIIAIKSNLPAEAVSTMEYCIANKVFGTDKEPRSQRILADAMKRSAAQEPTLASLTSAAGKSASGEDSLKLGEILLSYGQADKAMAAAKQALAKGAPADSVWMLIGRAQIVLKNRNEAVKAFSRVKGADASSVADLWGVYAGRA